MALYAVLRPNKTITTIRLLTTLGLMRLMQYIVFIRLIQLLQTIASITIALSVTVVQASRAHTRIRAHAPPRACRALARTPARVQTHFHTSLYLSLSLLYGVYSIWWGVGVGVKCSFVYHLPLFYKYIYLYFLFNLTSPPQGGYRQYHRLS